MPSGYRHCGLSRGTGLKEHCLWAGTATGVRNGGLGRHTMHVMPRFPWWPSTPMHRRERRLLQGGGIGTAMLVILFAGWLDRPFACYFEYAEWRRHGPWKALTKIGESHWWLVGAFVLAVACYVARRRSLAMRFLLLFCSVATSGLFVVILKVIFGRARPGLMFSDDPTYGFAFFRTGGEWNAFPSGHSATVAALCGVACILVPRGIILWCLAAGAVASTRVIMGSHCVSDVVAGFYVGIALAIVSGWCMRSAWAVPWQVGPEGRASP